MSDIWLAVSVAFGIPLGVLLIAGVRSYLSVRQSERELDRLGCLPKHSV